MEENEERRIFICEIDSIKFYNEKDYLEHYEEEHSDTYPFYCEPCERGFNSLGALISHKNNSFKHRHINIFDFYIYKNELY